MIFGLLVLAALIIIAVFGVRRLMVAPGGRPAGAQAVRRFFQYLVLYGLLVIAAVGLSGLLTRAVDRTAVVSDTSGLALSLAFSIVGVPLYGGLAAWTRRTVKARASLPAGAETRSLGWACYFAAACLTSLAGVMASLYGVLAWATRLEPYDPAAVAGVVVWGGIWAAHWRVEGRLTPSGRAQPHHLLGSLAGLGTSTAALAILTAGAIEVITGIGGSTQLVANDNRLLHGAILLAVGAPVWLIYWWRTASRSPRGSLWLAYVLLAGVTGGLVTAVVGASVVGYEVLVWFLGEPWSSQASVHFRGLPAAAGAAVAGTLVWWYHHEVVRAPARERTEVIRVYQYLMAGTGLTAAAVGLTMVIVATVEALTSSASFLGTSAVNTLLAALTIMLVGGPVWVVFWRRIDRSVRAAPAQEHASPTRRVYLIMLLGITGIATVVALLAGVYLLAEDVLDGSVGASTLHSMRFAIGILVTSGVIVGYHAWVYQADRAATHGDGPAGPHGPHYVLLVGPPDPMIVHAVERTTGGRVQTWRTDDCMPWTPDSVLAALATLGPAQAEEVVVVSEADGVHAIPVHRH